MNFAEKTIPRSLSADEVLHQVLADSDTKVKYSTFDGERQSQKKLANLAIKHLLPSQSLGRTEDCLNYLNYSVT